MNPTTPTTTPPRPIRITAAGATLNGDLTLPPHPRGLVIFAHGSGSSRLSPRNRRVAEWLGQRGLATLLFDLLTEAEEAVDVVTGTHRFDIALLATRLVGVVEWAAADPDTRALRIGCFGASTGAAAALVAAATRPQLVGAVVSRGGRPDLAGPYLARVEAPTLLIVGGRDAPVIELNQTALRAMTRATVELVIVPGATHLFEEPGTLERVADLAGAWFARYLEAAPAAAARE
ncbi:MAG TPA: dienelactone hydrolase family protein [Gemmatimonadales bacterium]|nr:dienelactone hydrolase family protein [Gemmatimonadales bacterium]